MLLKEDAEDEPRLEAEHREALPTAEPLRSETKLYAANKQTNPAGRSQLLRYQWGNPGSQLATRVTD